MLNEAQSRSNDAYLEQIAQAARLEAGWIRGALKNRAYAISAAPTNAQGFGGPTIIGAAVVPVKSTGLFYAWASMQVNAVAADSVTMTLTTQNQAAAFAFTQGAQPASGTSGQVVVSTGAAGTGISVTGGPFSEATAVTQVVTVGTAGVNTLFSWSGILQRPVVGTTEQPFGGGQNVCFLVKLTDSVANRTISGLTFGIIELP